MPKFACSCGYVMNLSIGTSEAEFNLIPERVIGVVGQLLSKGPLTEEEFYNAIDPVTVNVYRCPNCNRLHLEELGKNRFRSYIQESD